MVCPPVREIIHELLARGLSHRTGGQIVILLLFMYAFRRMMFLGKVTDCKNIMTNDNICTS